jgi:flavorubredoxin
MSAVKAVVVYESFWGNTAAIARAIAEGLGPEVRALSTSEASGKAMADVDLIVAGAPVLGFQLPTDGMRENIAANQIGAPRAPDLSHPSMRSWLATLPAGHGRFATFETGLRWSPGGATSAIVRGLETAGYRPLVKGRRFVVKGKFGPLRDGELEKARRWGAELAQAAVS